MFTLAAKSLGVLNGTVRLMTVSLAYSDERSIFGRIGQEKDIRGISAIPYRRAYAGTVQSL